MRMIRPHWSALAALAAAALVGCETPVPATSPGALPHGRSDVQPKLSSATYLAHGQLLERQGNFEAALEQYHRALDLTPDAVGVLNRLGVTLNKAGRHAEATETFRKAAALNPRGAYLKNNLGFSLYLEGKYEEADAIFAKAITQSPNFSRLHMNRGLVLAKLGEFELALSEFKAGSTEADAFYNLALVQTDAGHYDAAARALERALAVNPEMEPARKHLREIARLAAEEREHEELAVKAAPIAPAPLPATDLPVAAVAASETTPEAELVAAAHIEPDAIDPAAAQPDALPDTMAPAADEIGVAEPATTDPTDECEIAEFVRIYGLATALGLWPNSPELLNAGAGAPRIEAIPMSEPDECDEFIGPPASPQQLPWWIEIQDIGWRDWLSDVWTESIAIDTLFESAIRTDDPIACPE